MDYLPQIFTIYAVYLVAAIAPGQDFVVIAGTTLGTSRRHGVLTALGVTTGAAIWVTGAILGLTLVLAEMGFLARAIRLVGGAYLIFLGLMALRSTMTRNIDTVASPVRVSTLKGAYFAGLFANLGNPKTAIFFLSVMSLLLTPETPTWAKLAAGLGMIAISVMWYGLIACVLSMKSVRERYRRGRRWIDGVVGAALVGLGGSLVLSRQQ